MTWLETVQDEFEDNDGMFDLQVDIKDLEYMKVKLLAVIADRLEALNK